MRLNYHVGLVIMQISNTQKLNISEINTQNIPNYHVCSLDERESKSINTDKILSHVCSTDKRKSKSAIVNSYSLDESESNIFHISVNASKVKYATNETKYEEPFATDNAVINTPTHFKLFECGKTFLNNLDSTYEQACM